MKKKMMIVGAALGVLLSAAAAQAGPITYNYTFNGSLPGALSFTLNAAPTPAQQSGLADIKGQITAFTASIDGQVSTSSTCARTTVSAIWNSSRPATCST